MANAKINLVSGGTTYTYTIVGLLRVNDSKTQETPALPIPTQSDDSAILTTVVGQKRELIFDFILLERDDDYTGGTGSPGSSPYSIADQKAWLMDTIFTPTGKHQVVDENGLSFDGRIQSIEFTKQGDDPLSDSAIVRFTRGVAF